ncbi:MAG: hypothetical protein ACFCVD_17610 [Nodosilinea sp.]
MPARPGYHHVILPVIVAPGHLILEHNFGPGQQHLAITLLTLNGLACLFHPVLPLVVPPTSGADSGLTHPALWAPHPSRGY